MKKINLTITLIILTIIGTRAQDTLTNPEHGQLPEINDEMYNDTLSENRSDSIEIKIKNKSIIIDDDKVTIGDDKKEKYYSYEKKKRKKKNFDGHLEGFELGMANFLDKDHQLSRDSDNEFMDLNTGRSHIISIYPESKSFKLISSRFGLVTAAGFSWVNYHFDNNNSIQKNPETGRIEERLYTELLNKTKLSVGYLNIPVLLELQPFGFGQRAYISAGVIGDLKLFSYTKIVYRSNSDKQKSKEKGDYNLTPLRYALTARAGYNDFGIYANYYPVQLFEKAKGPELYPFMVGITMNLD